MITVYSSKERELIGLSTDIKPTNVGANMLFLELDTGDFYYFDGKDWKVVGGETNNDDNDDKEDEEDEGMVIETVYGKSVTSNNGPGYVSTISAQEAIDAYKSGKNLVVHFSGSSGYGDPEDYYMTIVAYEEEPDEYSSNPAFGLNAKGDTNTGPNTMINSIETNESGYMVFKIYVD